MRVFVFAIVFAIAIAGLALAPSTAADEPCPSPTHAIYDIQGNLLSCEEEVGAPESCPDDTLPGYLASGELAGCFERSMHSWYEICYPDDADTDGDGRGDACDPCPNDADCDGDTFTDGVELYVGTDPLDNCPDDADDAAWPFDINNDTWSNIVDVLLYKGHLMCQVGDLCYNRRLDLNADGWVNIVDVLLYKGNLPVQCSQEGIGSLALDAPTPDASTPDAWAMGDQWSWWLPFNEQVVHQHSTHRWCWWDLAQGWWQCQDKYWVRLDQTFYWCELGAVTVGPHTVDYGANLPFVEGDTWYEQSIYSQTHVRGLAGMEVWVQRGSTSVHFPVETWVDYYESRPYEAGESGFLAKGDLNPDDEMGHYSYKGGSSCLSEGDRVDPISVVFYGGWDYTEVEDHACVHGSWCFHSGDPQMFWNHGCWEQDGQANSANPPLTQYHMRILTGRYWDGTYAYDPVLGMYNLTTPHHEYWTLPQIGCGDSGHSVDDNDLEPPGGFVRAREDIVDNWVRNGPHKWRSYEYWDNTEHRRQSAGKGYLGGCWYAWNDGLVALISLEHE